MNPVISWVIYLQLTCVTFGCTVLRWRWGFLWGHWMWVCMWKRVVGWFCSSVCLECVSHSQTCSRRNSPCFVRVGREVAVWGFLSTYSCWSWNMQIFRPAAAHILMLLQPFHRFFFQQVSIWGMCKDVCFFCLWMHNRICNSDLTLAELKGLWLKSD